MEWKNALHEKPKTSEFHQTEGFSDDVILWLDGHGCLGFGYYINGSDTWRYYSPEFYGDVVDETTERLLCYENGNPTVDVLWAYPEAPNAIELTGAEGVRVE